MKGAEGQFLKEGLSLLLFNVVCINHQSPGFLNLYGITTESA